MGDASEDNDHHVIWKIGVFDAHSHPTDIMASIKDIAAMKARVLTIMASRSQDQDLVSQTATMYPLPSQESLTDVKTACVIPAFGWHPWFSYQLYDDTQQGYDSSQRPSPVEHLKAVLTPAPENEDFLQTLPLPRPLSEFLAETEEKLKQHPLALVGEVGLDRAFRLPHGPHRPPKDATFTYASSREPEAEEQTITPGSREGRSLTPYKVSLDHQKTILKAQLQLAGKFNRPVSIHSVQGHGIVFELLQSLWAGHEKMSKRQQKRRRSAAAAHDDDEEQDPKQEKGARDSSPFPPRICMHSYSGPADPLRQFLHPSVPPDIYFSFSNLVNFSSTSSKAVDVIKTVPESRILAESDYHCAGKRMDELLEDIIVKICEIKGWSLKRGTEQLRDNYERFIFGD